MTCTPTSSPTRRAAAAPASVAALTDATSPRTMAVTSPASTFCQPTNTTFAALTMASAASIMPTRPRVSMRPSASPGSSFAMCPVTLLQEPRTTNHEPRTTNNGALQSLDSPACRDVDPIERVVVADEPYFVHQVRDNARVIRHDAYEIAGLQR